MARKFPSLPPPDSPKSGSQGSQPTTQSPERIDSSGCRSRQNSSTDAPATPRQSPVGQVDQLDRLSPLPPTSDSRRNSLSYGGARPRSASFRSNPEEAMLRRRRLDSLNLEMPTTTTTTYGGTYSEYDGSPRSSMMENTTEAFIEGQELYLHFVHERFRNEGLRPEGLK
jgi:hypothetical protein